MSATPAEFAAFRRAHNRRVRAEAKAAQRPACVDHFVGAEILRCETCGWNAATLNVEVQS